MNDKIAYLIIAHNDPDNFKRLIRKLNYHADFFVHIDRRADIDSFKSSLENFDNVYFVDDYLRIPVNWGSISQVEVTLLLIRIVLQTSVHTKRRYLKCVLLSGACYPIKDSKFIYNYFSRNSEHNFIRAMNISSANVRKYNYCIENYLFYNFTIFHNRQLTRVVRGILNFIFRITKKKNYITASSKKIEVYHGSQWWALNQEVIQEIESISQEKHLYLDYFKYSLASDEKYFHTIFFNSNFKDTNYFKGPEPFYPETRAFANLHVIHESLQKWYTIEDLDNLKESPMLFVRKVSTKYSSSLLDELDNL
jgi:hypothetical protein